MTHREHQDEQKRRPDLRRILTGGLAILLAVLLLLPMLTMAMGSAGAVTQSEIDALEQEQKESQARQDELLAYHLPVPGIFKLDKILFGRIDLTPDMQAIASQWI